MSLSLPNSKGFTLLEVLLAIGITAVIGISTYTLLSQTLRTRDHLSVQAENLRNFQLSATILQNDIRQISNRSIRDQFGDRQPALRLGGYSLYGSFEFTKSGISNPLVLPRSNLQRISYGLRDEQLIRYIWPVLDQAPDSEPREQVLFEGVVELEIKVLNDANEWKASWPSQDNSSSDQDPTPNDLPNAVSIQVSLNNDKTFRWTEQILSKQ